VFAATKAFVSGQFQPGHPFPSVRALASELKIHPGYVSENQDLPGRLTVGEYLDDLDC
jgi:hypothetical protein